MLAIYVQYGGVIDDMTSIAYNQVSRELDFVDIIAGK